MASIIGSTCGSRRRIVPSSTWGCSNFWGCKFCRRDRNVSNPNEKEKSFHPKLKFRSERHLECNMCWGSIRQALPGIDKKAYESKLNDPENYDSHCCMVENFEDQLNGKIAKVRQRVPPGQADIDAPPEQVKSLSGTSLEAKKFLGVFWPLKLFIDKEKRKPRKDELTEIEHCDEILKGVLRSESFGRPVGTIDLHQTSYATVQKVVQIHDSDRAIHADEGAEVMKFAQSKMKIAVAEKETKNSDGTKQTVVRLSGFAKKKAPAPMIWMTCGMTSALALSL